MTSIILADDHPIVRQGLRATLQEDGYQIVGEAANGREAVQLVERFRPDMLIVDMEMPLLSGTEVARQVQHLVPHTRVIVLSIHADESYVLEALRGGALAYVLKDAATEMLQMALREVQAGRRFLSPPLNERAIAAYVAQTWASQDDVLETLTAREREILLLVAQRHTNHRIGEMLSISHRTVDTHRTNLMRKLDLHSQADLAEFVRTHRLLPGF
ncbi:MAG: response regulator transcription factor [Chloroflexaceae bacterium]|jgi:DNA-binding NarL/FixJ family response regulator|nr:response regulator transcription factor [Chloroflexaceae bacterium]